MKKCEWKDDDFYGCNVMESRLKTGRYRNDYPLFNDGTNYCFSCGADIRKPEPEVIIKKSGGTWVARYDGIDYLCCSDGSAHDPEYFEQELSTRRIWFKISEIEITDEISKLRPLVVLEKYQNNNIHELIGVRANVSIHWHAYMMSDSSFTKDIRLATVSDLENEEIL